MNDKNYIYLIVNCSKKDFVFYAGWDCKLLYGKLSVKNRAAFGSVPFSADSLISCAESQRKDYTMWKRSFSIDIKGTPRQVWDIWCDVSNWSTWDAGIVYVLGSKTIEEYFLMVEIQ